MKILICTFFSHNYSKKFYESLKDFNFLIDDCGFFCASDICENWPYDFNISKLKNTCLDAAKQIKPEWMVMLPGCDGSLLQVPDINSLDKEVLYYGFKKNKNSELREVCSLHMYSQNIYNNFRYSEKFKFFWDDFDFFLNQTHNIKKNKHEDLVCLHDNHESLVNEIRYVKDRFFIEQQEFMCKYKLIHGKDFSS